MSGGPVWSVHRPNIYHIQTLPLYHNTAAHLSDIHVHPSGKTPIITKFRILLLLLLTATALSFGGSSPYTSTDKTNKNKYT